jgi:glycosyltransferase involved in cell wall biosynthesis
LRLVIAGEGPDETALRSMIVQLDLESRVVLLGRVQNLPALIAQATFFVLSSGCEGS